MSELEAPSGASAYAEHPFLRGLDPDLLAALRPGVAEREFAAGDTLVQEGEPADEFFLLTRGKVALEIVLPDRPRRTIQTLGPGEVLGWSWLLPPRRWRLDARAVKETHAIALEAAVLRRALEAHPAAAYQFLLRLLPVVTERLEHTRLQLLDLHSPGDVEPR